MIDVVIWKAKEDTVFQKNGTFLRGESYFGRLSKNGDCYVIRSEEGYWIPIEHYKMTIMGNKEYYFSRKATIYMRNRTRLNEFYNVNQYVNSGDAKQWWYGGYKDKSLWGDI